MQAKNIVDLESEIVQAFSDNDYNNFVYKVIEPDPILEKIHQFTFNPPIEIGFSSYPVQLKGQEFDKISSAEDAIGKRQDHPGYDLTSG